MICTIGILMSKTCPPRKRDKLSEKKLHEERLPVPNKKDQIAIILQTLNNNFFTDLKNGFQNGADTHGVKVELFAAPGEADRLIQTQWMEDVLLRQFDLIALDPPSTSNLLKPAERATKKGIPLINVSAADISMEALGKHNIDIISFISTDCAEKLADESGRIARIMGLPGSTAATQRLAGYDTELAKLSKLQNVAVFPSDWDRKKAMDVSDAMLATDCDGIPDAGTAIQNNELAASVAVMQNHTASTRSSFSKAGATRSPIRCVPARRSGASRTSMARSRTVAGTFPAWPNWRSNLTA